MTRNISSSIFLLDWFKDWEKKKKKTNKQIKTRHSSTLCFKKLIHKWTWMITSTLTRLNLLKKIFQRWFVHSNILFFECFGNGNYKIEKLNWYTRNEFHLSKASAILPLIVSVTKFSIVIGSPYAYLSRLRCAITWVSNCGYPIIFFFVIGYHDSYVNYARVMVSLATLLLVFQTYQKRSSSQRKFLTQKFVTQTKN